MDLWVVDLVVEENKSASVKGKLGNTNRQPQRPAEIGVGDRQMLNLGDQRSSELGDQRRSELGDHRFEISGESTSVSLEFGENLISPSLN